VCGGVAIGGTADSLASILPKDGQDIGSPGVTSSYLSEFSRSPSVREESKEDLDRRITTAKEGDAGLEGTMVVAAAIQPSHQKVRDPRQRDSCRVRI